MTKKQATKEMWVLYGSDGRFEGSSFDPPTAKTSDYWTRSGRRLVHLVEHVPEDAAELRLLRRLYRALLRDLPHAYPCRCPVCRSVAAVEKAKRKAKR